MHLENNASQFLGSLFILLLAYLRNSREVEYGASRRGFEPSGTDINVPPTVLSNNELDYDDGQYRDEPAAFNEYSRASAPSSRPRGASRKNNQQSFPAAPAPAIRYSSPAAPVSAPAPPPAQNWNYNSAPTPAPVQNWNYNPAPTPAPTQNWRWNQQPARNNWYNPTPAPYQAHPQAANSAANINYRTGSYSLSYVG